jgi:hypothetical protein
MKYCLEFRDGIMNIKSCQKYNTTLYNRNNIVLYICVCVCVCVCVCNCDQQKTLWAQWIKFYDDLRGIIISEKSFSVNHVYMCVYYFVGTLMELTFCDSVTFGLRFCALVMGVILALGASLFGETETLGLGDRQD